MKSSIAAFVTAVSNFSKINQKFDGSISLLITGDEEGIAINGTKKVVEYLRKRKEKIDFCLVGEPTNPNKLGEMIKIGRRGSMTGKLSVIGIQGHVAYPNRANNPSTALVQILKELKEIKFDKGTKDFQPTNLEITKINIDNSADNVIPGLANASFNIRFNNKHTSYKLKNKINKIIKQICNKNKSKYKIEYSVSGEAFLTKPNKTTFMIQNTIKKVTKIKPKLSTTGGTSDARFIRKIAPCLEFGLVGKTMHKVGECVSLSDLKRLTLIYTKILDNYFKWKLVLITSDTSQNHDTGPGHPEQIARVSVIVENFKKLNNKNLIWKKPSKVSDDILLTTHEKNYLNLVKSSFPKKGFSSLDGDTIISPGSKEATFDAVGSIIAAIDGVEKKEFRNAFCGVRPPGHHSSQNKAAGFCILNSVSIGANYLLKKYKYKKVAIIDFDVHHGNGTQDIFYENENALYFKINFLFKN